MVPGYGEVKYNDYVFPATYQMKLDSEPEYIQGTELIRYYVHTLTISFIVTTELATLTNAANSIDTEMIDLKKRLQEPRRELSFTYQGAGLTTSVTCGTGASTDDINGGPVPQINSWEPIGTNAAARVSWSVVFYTTWCMNESGNFNDLATYSINHNFSINEDGTARITRTFEAIKKHKVIGFDPDMINHIDANRNLALFIPNLLAGFRRIKQTFNIAANGRKLTGEIVDDEEPSNNSIFPYCIKVSADHSLESSLMPSGKMSGAGFMTWDNDISATVQVAPGYSSGVAWQVFLWILYQRFYRLSVYGGAAAQGKNEKGTTDNVAPRNILTSIRMKESLFTRVHTFQAKYFGVYNLRQLLLQSGMFYPINTVIDRNGLYPWENGYAENRADEAVIWRTTVAERVTTPLGFRQARIDPSQAFVLFNPCASLYENVGANPNLSATLPTGQATPNYHPVQTSGSQATIFNQSTSNYLKYENEFNVFEKTRNYAIGIQEYSTDIANYKQTTSQEIGGINSELESGSLQLNGKKTGSYTNQPTAVASIGGGSVFVLKMKGFAIRHGYPAPCPAVVSYAGQPVQRINEPIYVSKQISEGLAPLYLTKWEIDYLIPFQVSGNMLTNIVGNVFRNDFLEKTV